VNATESPGNRPLTIVVLMGGDSAEREISLQSGAAVAAALDRRGHDVLRLDPAAFSLRAHDWAGVDAVFIALHGRFGEDGQVQEVLESAGVSYTGSGPNASRLAFSKSAAKERFLQCGVPTPPYALVHRADSAPRTRQLAETIGYPLVVKPDQQGSSLGVTIVQAPEQFPAALAACFAFGPFGLIEKAVLGTEWTLALFDDQPLPLIRIDTPHAFFDFDAKYAADSTRYVLEFQEPSETLHAITDAGMRACTALDTEGIARVDLRLDESLQPWVLEVNTVPGMTDHSLVPKAAARAGLTFDDLCDRAIRSALLRRHVPHNARDARNRPQPVPRRRAG
jgi:D-alanine-D-alanine ligase